MENLAVKVFTLAMFFFVIPLSMAQIQTLGTFTQNQDINLSQVCASCTYVNMQKVKFPDSTETYINTNMVQEGQTFYYEFSKTSQLGQYIVTTCGDLAGTLQCANYDFYVTSNGQSFSNSQALALLPMIALIGILFGIGLSFSSEKWKVKSFFFAMSLLATVVLINSTLIMFSTSSSLHDMGTAALIIGIVVVSFYMVFLFIYYMIEIFDKLKQSKQKKVTKSDPY